MTGLSGSLLSLDVLREVASSTNVRALAGRLRTILTDARRTIGPASAARTVLDAQVLPVVRLLGFDLSLSIDSSSEVVGTLSAEGHHSARLTVGSWGTDLRRLSATGWSCDVADLRWIVVANGAVLRIVDGSRMHARRTFDVDLERIDEDDEALCAVVRVFRPDADGRLGALERCAADSDAHRTAVGQSLQVGVEQALVHLIGGLTRRRLPAPAALDAALAEALTVVYRILFLLFAEARGLVPHWHPVYRRSYTIESLRPKIERHSRPSGVWQALQAISRLAHRGCHAGTLRVTPFNGRLFAPATTPLAESIAIDDRRVRDVLLAITTRPSSTRRERISYADLGVEQLGSVYERVLDYSPAVVDGGVTLVRSGRRKATGTFYTPRAMTEYLVRRTLAPLVRDRSADAVLDLRVLDPAMGSGAFLVAACRYLADAYERALIRDGAISAADVGPPERAAFRRAVAQRCLYGVDRNPTAVQLARLSLWLCTLAADRPLTFLDHHLHSGNSLVGAAPQDILRQPPLGPRRSSQQRIDLPLFDAIDLHARIGATVGPRTEMATQPDDTADAVRHKERQLATLEAKHAPLAAWRALADGWCAVWFWPSADTRIDRTGWGSLVAALSGQPSGLPPAVEEEWLGTIREVSARERFFHWELEFPEVFFDREGRPRENAGFDAVIGNPPWDTLRASADVAEAGPSAHALTRFSRDSGCYRLQGHGHANLYQLFTERAMQLARPGGRLGLLLPSGLIADHGCAGLRTHLFARCRLDALVSFDNRDGLFPIHRGIRFVLLTAEMEGRTTDIQAIFGLRSAKALEPIADEGAIPGAVSIPMVLVDKVSGPDLAVPELHTDLDRRIVASVVATAPPLGRDDGWDCRFGRELNASDDRRHFSDRGLPILEGKSLEPFRADVAASKARIRSATAARLLGHRAAFDRPRLGYREVAASSNMLTLIAAMIPAGTVTTHTIFCLKEPLDADSQWFLCGMFNSFVANYLIRLRGSTHVTASMMSQLPVPRPATSSIDFRRIGALARVLSAAPDAADAHAELHARAARLYAIDATAFAHVLSTFPLVDRRVRDGALAALRHLMDAV